MKKIIVEINTEAGNEVIDLNIYKSILDAGDSLTIKSVGNSYVYAEKTTLPIAGHGVHIDQDYEYKPEPEQPIIKKSGGTWIMLKDGIDYFWPANGHSKAPIPGNINWKPILDLEITDEIAKLNPLVSVRDFRNNYNLCELIGVKDHTVISWDGENSIDSAMHDVELATIDIIENLED